MSPRTGAAVAVAVCLALGACADDRATSPAAATAPPRCPTRTAGRLVVAHPVPASPPWFVGGDPSRGEGFEAAVVYAVAAGAGFGAGQVDWVDAGGPEPFDLAVGQLRVADSAPYYVVNQALVATAESPAVGVATVDDVRDLRLGVVAGSPGGAAAVDRIQPSVAPLPLPEPAAAAEALGHEEVDAVLVDYPTAWALVTFQLDEAAVVAQFPPAEPSDTFGFEVAGERPLRRCVDAAIAELTATGALDELRRRWLVDVVQVPVIEVG